MEINISSERRNPLPLNVEVSLSMDPGLKRIQFIWTNINISI